MLIICPEYLVGPPDLLNNDDFRSSHGELTESIPL